MNKAFIEDTVLTLEHDNLDSYHKLLDTRKRPCMLCSGEMVKRSGPHGDFLGCSNYPKCHQKAKL